MTAKDAEKRTVEVIIIGVDGNADLRTVEPTLEAMQGIVGGYIEPINPMVSGYGNWHGYVDEDGKSKGLPLNVEGQNIAVMLGWGGELAGDFLVGPLVLLGSTPDGEEASVPRRALAAVLAYYDRHGSVEVKNHRSE
jgi:hypothetical protein